MIKKIRLHSKLSTKDQIVLFRRLAVLLKAALPILECLQLLKRQTRSKAARDTLKILVTDIEQGLALSKSLSKFKNSFSPLTLSLVAVGEASGALDKNLLHIAHVLEKTQSLKRKILSALIYPAFIVIGTLGITAFLTIYLFPKIMPIFRSLNFELPWTTKLVLSLSNVLSHQWGLIIISLLVIIFSGWRFLGNPKILFRVQLTFLKLPILSRLIQNYELANFCRTLGALLDSHIVIVEAINIAAQASGNLVYQKTFLKISEAVTRGQKISLTLDQEQKLFPAITTELLAAAETAGNVSETLIYLSQFHENEVDDLTKNLTTLIEPVLMVFMGLLVGLVALSIITPVYEVTQHIHP